MEDIKYILKKLRKKYPMEDKVEHEFYMDHIAQPIQQLTVKQYPATLRTVERYLDHISFKVKRGMTAGDLYNEIKRLSDNYLPEHKTKTDLS
jgi:hypothetical protein